MQEYSSAFRVMKRSSKTVFLEGEKSRKPKAWWDFTLHEFWGFYTGTSILPNAGLRGCALL
jgi:hypothetical protein